MTEIEIPVLGKLKTNCPSLGAIPRRYFEPLNAIALGQENIIRFGVDAADSYSVIAFTPQPGRAGCAGDLCSRARAGAASDGFLFENKLIGGN